MSVVRYLPSTQFAVIVSSIVISGGLVVAAQKYTHQSTAFPTLVTSVSTQPNVPQKDWLKALQEIEGSSITTPESISTSTKTLLEAAQSPNITDTVARTLFINLSQAKSQGLGSDIPTQDKLIAEAAAKIQQERGLPTYSLDDLTISDNNPTSFKTFGNEFLIVVSKHPKANYEDTLLAIGKATDVGDKTLLTPLITIQKEYTTLAQELHAVAVPPILAPLHLQIVNNFARIASTYGDMMMLFEDPLRGLAGFELYQGLNDETLRVFTNIAQQFAQNGILFNKDEPGSSWSMLLSL